MKTSHQIIGILLVAFTGTTIAKAQDRLLLDSVIARVNINPSLLAFDSRVSAQRAYAAGAKSLDAPKLSAGQYQTPYQLNPNTGSFMIQAEQMFTNPAKLKAKEEYMQGMSKVTTEDKNYFKNQLVAQAKQGYFERLVLERKLAQLQNTKNLLEYMLKDANIRLTYGKENLSNIYKAKAEIFELDNNREQFANEIVQRNILLNTLMNRNKLAAFDIDTNYVLKNYDSALTDSADLAEKRSDLKSINRNIELQQLNARLEFSKRKPDFGIQAGHMFSYGNMANQYILMASVTIPIAPWASKEYQANSKGIQFEVEELKQKKADIINQAEGQLTGLKLNIASTKKQLMNYKNNIIPALQNSYKTALLAYDQNTGDLPAVLNSIKDLQAARMAYLDNLQLILTLQVAYERENESN